MGFQGDQKDSPSRVIFHAEALRLMDAVRAWLSAHGSDATGNKDALVFELKRLCSKVELKSGAFS